MGRVQPLGRVVAISGGGGSGGSHMTAAELRAALGRIPTLRLAPLPSPVEALSSLSAVLGGGPKLLVKRDDTLGFAFGGNKVRKLELLGARAQAAGCDTLITSGGLQSNHARVTAATAVKLGIDAVLVVNSEHGKPPTHPSANALLDTLLGAQVIYVDTRDGRIPAMRQAAERLTAAGRKVFEIPIGGSTPLGSIAYVHAVLELLDQIPAPDIIIHSTSSGGTQAGIVAACRLLGLSTRVIGIAADGPTVQIQSQIRANIEGIAELLELNAEVVKHGTPIDVDDRFFGDGYAIPTDSSREAIELTARTEAIFLDPVYTGKAMAGLIAYVRQQKFTSKQTVLFWHTGGQVGLFA